MNNYRYKIKFIFIISFMINILLYTNIFALDIPIVNIDKIWTIKFNQDIDFNQDFTKSINIKDENNFTVDVNVIKSINNNEIKIQPINKYKENTIYTLTIKNNIKSIGNKNLKLDKEFQFKTNSNNETVIFDTEKLAENTKSVVYIEMYRYNIPYCSGSGWFINKNTIVTNYHVIDGNTDGKIVCYDNKEYRLKKIIKANKNVDIAILEVEDTSGQYPIMELGNSDDIKLGQEIMCVGSPLGLKNTISIGIVSAIRSDNGRNGYKDIQITAQINHGSSGGLLLGIQNNKVVGLGITYAGYADTTGDLNFSIPVNDLKKLSSNEIASDISNKIFTGNVAINVPTTTDTNTTPNNPSNPTTPNTPTSPTPSQPETPSKPSYSLDEVDKDAPTINKSLTKDNIKVTINKLVQDDKQIRIYVTYENLGKSSEVITEDSNFISVNGNDSYVYYMYNYSEHKSWDIKITPSLLKVGGKIESVIFIEKSDTVKKCDVGIWVWTELYEFKGLSMYQNK